MAVSKSWLCDKIAEMCGHVRKKPRLNGFTKKELLIVYAHLNLEQDGGNNKKKVRK